MFRTANLVPRRCPRAVLAVADELRHWVWFDVPPPLAEPAALLLGAFAASCGLLEGLDLVAVSAHSLDHRGGEDWCAWDPLGGQADDVIHLLNCVRASRVSELAGLVAPADLGLHSVRYPGSRSAAPCHGVVPYLV